MSKAYPVFIGLFMFVTSISSQATIMYDAEASSTFTLIDSGGLVISAVSSPEGPSSAVTGTGVASIDADTQSDPTLFTVIPLTQSSAVSGSASSPFGTSVAESLNSFFIEVGNPTDMELTAEFSFSYTWSLTLTQAPPADALFEAGFASAFFHLDGFAPSGSETLAIDEGLGAGVVPVADWLFNPEISFVFDDVLVPAMETGTTTVSVFVTAPEMSSNRFSVITDASGAATSIASPPSLSLVLLGLLALGFLGRNKIYAYDASINT